VLPFTSEKSAALATGATADATSAADAAPTKNLLYLDGWLAIE